MSKPSEVQTQAESESPDDGQQPTVAPSRRGRKPTGDRALTRAEIQRNYRRLKEDWKYQGLDHIPNHDRLQLMARLSRDLGAMEAINDPSDDFYQGAKHTVEMILQELVNRFELAPPKKQKKGQQKTLGHLRVKAKKARTGAA